MLPVTAENAEEVAKATAARVRAASAAPLTLASPDPPTGWVKLHHSSGALVTLPVMVAPLDYAAMFANVTRAVEAGFLVREPGLEAGEMKEEVGFVVRRSKDNDRGGVTPVIDLYPANDRATFAILTIYLNTPEEVAAFEAGTGAKLDRIPKYIGDNKIERGKKRELDELVYKLPRPVGVVYGKNPKYDETEAAAVAARGKGEIYGVPKRKFLRWADTKPAATTANVPPQVAQSQGEISLRETLAGKFRACKSGDRVTYLAICDEVGLALLHKKITEADRVWLRGPANECASRCPPMPPKPAPVYQDPQEAAAAAYDDSQDEYIPY